MKKDAKMDVETKLTVLSDIRQVDVPPFLYTRIEAKINYLNGKRIVPRKIVLSMAAAAILLFIFNLLAIRLELKKDACEEISSQFVFTEQNDLYHE